jgi:hypothetical protein
MSCQDWSCYPVLSRRSSVGHEESQIRISVFSEESVNISGLRSVRRNRHPSKRDFGTDLVFAPLVRTKIILRVRTVTATVTDVDSVCFATM